MRHISKISLYLLCVILTISCKDEKLIPKGQFAEIYAEMFIMDQWVASNREVRHKADTTMVYGQILQKYGYTPDVYLATVESYMDDPETYSKILENTVGIIDERLEVLKEEKKEIDRRRDYKLLVELMRMMIKHRPEDTYPYLNDEPYVHYYDSLAVQYDTIVRAYRFHNISRSDTTYDGVRMIIKENIVENGK